MLERVLDSERDRAEISALKYRYLRLLDTQDWVGFTDCFVPDATADYAGLSFVGRAALVDYLSSHLGSDVHTLHQVHHPELTVDPDAPEDPDRAAGTWYLQDKVVAPAHQFVLEGAAFYRDRYVRTPAGWRLAHTGYERTFEMTWSLSDLPSARISAPARTPRD